MQRLTIDLIKTWLMAPSDIVCGTLNGIRFIMMAWLVCVVMSRADGDLQGSGVVQSGTDYATTPQVLSLVVSLLRRV